MEIMLKTDEEKIFFRTTIFRIKQEIRHLNPKDDGFYIKRETEHDKM